MNYGPSVPNRRTLSRIGVKCSYCRGVGHGGVPAMTHKVITLEFIVPTALAIVLGIALSVCAVYLADTYLFPVSQLEADYSAAVRR